MKKYKLPDALENWIDKQLKNHGYGLNQTDRLAKAIMSVADHFQNSDSATPWSDPEHWAAYYSYYFPLNYVRSLKVIDEALAFDFFAGIGNAVDYGCGPGTLTKAILQTSTEVTHFWGVDINPKLKGVYLDTPRSSQQLQFVGSQWPQIKGKKLLLASYVFNEQKGIPEQIFEFDRLLIMEPSTHQAFPGFLNIRDQLLEKGFQILAPCPHGEACPLSQSKKDWCHDRVHWEPPGWYQAIENKLPIKNRTLTHSYLLASKDKLAKPEYSRVVGDPLKEKGKTRWMLCRSSEREFLSHLKKQGRAPEINRGQRIQIEGDQQKGNEVRFESIQTLGNH